MLGHLDVLRERAERRGPVVEALLANFEPGKRGESVAISEVHEVVGLAMGAIPSEGQTGGGWQRKFPRNVYVTSRIEVGRLFGKHVHGHEHRQTTRFTGVRWRADAPDRERVRAIREAADARRYGLVP